MNRHKILFIYCISIVIAVCFAIFWISKSSLNEILETVISTKEHKKPLRTPGVFKEDFSDISSKGELTFLADSAFKFQYEKSVYKPKPFVGVWFPLENVDIDFSKYDYIEVGIKTKRAKRIPFNLSVQNRLETHQYVRTFIEVVEGKHVYEVSMEDFFTPSDWYTRNRVAQVEIPKQDFSKVEAMSFESCQLLEPGQKDEYNIFQLTLRKDNTTYYIILTVIALILIIAGWIVLMQPFKKKTEVLHVPINPIEYEKTERLESRILTFLAKNYTNPNLTLNDLRNEFGKSNAELSKVIKNETKLSFPKYLNSLRIEEAKRILKTGDFKTVAEVGYIVGFNSPSNFIRVFKGIVGLSPKKYLEN